MVLFISREEIQESRRPFKVDLVEIDGKADSYRRGDYAPLLGYLSSL
jgi:hypothetical protein